MSEPVDVHIPDKMFFRIGELAELIGVEPHVLRYWEQEFRIRPQRSQSGQRTYRRKDIVRFLQIKRLLYEQGFTIAGARRALLDPAKGDAPEEPRQSDARQRLDDLRQKIANTRLKVARAWEPHVPRA